MKNILTLALIGCMVFATTGCNEERKIPTERIAEKITQAQAARDLGDYFLREKYYTEAQKQYELAVKYANQALGYDENNQEVTAFITATWEILRDDPITLGCEGKLLIEGEWVKPEDYMETNLAKIEAEVDSETRKLLEDNWKSLTGLGNRHALANPAKSEAGKNIIATGRKALPFLASKIQYDYFAAPAARLAFAIPDRDDVVRCLLLTSLNNFSEDVVVAAIEAAPLFPDKSVTVALLNEVAKKKARTTEAAIRAIILLNSPLGRHVLADMLSETPDGNNIKGYILSNLYLFEDDRAVDLLLDFIARDNKYLMLAASNSLLKMQSDKALPALNTVLKNYEFFQKGKIDQTYLLITIIDRLGEAKYPDAGENLEAIFTSDVFITDEPARAAIKALNSVADIDGKALDTLLDLLMRNSTGNAQDKFWKEIAGYVVSHKNEKVMNALIGALAECERETAIKIAYTLGMCRDDDAVGALAAAFKKFRQRSAKETILPVIFNALTAIGSKRSIDEMFRLADQLSGDNKQKRFVLEIADNISPDETSKQTYEFIFANLRGDDIEFGLWVLNSFENYAPPAAAPYIRTLAADDKAPMEIRLGAVGALRSYSENPVTTETLQIIENIIAALESAPNQHLYFIAQKYLLGYKSPELTKLYLRLLSDPKTGNWKLHTLAADCLLERKGDLAINKFLDKIAELREAYVEQKDFLTAVKLAEFAADPYAARLSIREKYIEEINKTFDMEKHPLKGGLLRRLDKITDILGETYEIVPPPATNEDFKKTAEEYKFAYFPNNRILIMFNNTDAIADRQKAAQSQIIKAIAYLPGCKFDFYGIKNGDSINAIAPILNPQRLTDQVAFVEKYRTYVLNFSFANIDNSPERRLMFIMKKADDGKQAIQYTTESLTLTLDVKNIDLMALFDIANQIIARERSKP